MAMGWAIQRQDGTFSGWYAAGKSDQVLKQGEQWVEVDVPPSVTTPPITPIVPPLLDAVEKDNGVQGNIRALLSAIVTKIGGV